VFFPYLNGSGAEDFDMGPRKSSKVAAAGDRGPQPLERNTYLGAWRESIKTKSQNDLERKFGSGKGCGEGVKLELIPPGLSRAPFIYKDGPRSYDMFFDGGIVGVTEDADGTLEPVLGWAVLDKI
jgi:hypothetical protein